MDNNKDKVKNAIARIGQGPDAINTDADWLKFLAFQSKFYNYSYGNTLLIYQQNPQSTFVKGYRAWNQLGRYVKRGAYGIMILAPCFRNQKNGEGQEDNKAGGKKPAGFRAAYVYDIADTAGSDEYLPVLVKGLEGNGAEEQEIYEKLKAHISRMHRIREVDGTAAKGSYDTKTGVICVRADMEYMQKIKTILHEYAHAIDFALNPGKEAARNIREVIAEGTAYVVARHLGLDTSAYSMGYIKIWLGDRKGLQLAADGIQKVAYKMITELSALGLKEAS